MIECPACLRRSLAAPTRLRLSTRNLHHVASTSATAAVEGPRLVRFANGSVGQGTDKSYKRSTLALRLNTSVKAARTRTSVDEADQKPSRRVERAIREELKWLQDPLKLAERVRATLQRNDEDKALALVRAASKSMDCVVSWNHIIDHIMRQGKTRIGQKLYNEMKKRAQFPDAHTYTIMLRGLAEYAHRGSSVVSALSIYHSLLAPNSRVKPTITHANAALNVCAKNNDMDALWGIAARLPHAGPGAANNYTFTTILNAMRQNALISKKETGDEGSKGHEAILQQGRTLWADVIDRWRRGDLHIDEELVCAMGRLLLIGERPRDWDDILSLVQQTMNIPRFSPRLGTISTPRMESPSLSGKNDWKDVGNVDDLFDDPPKTPMVRGAPASQTTSSLVYAAPGRNTLSLIMSACLSIGQRRVGSGYWELLTDSRSYNVVPDQDNKHSYLRILRQARAARDAVDFVRVEMAETPALAKTYRIAMSTCLRSIGVARQDDVTAVKAANELFEIMKERLCDVDVTTLRQYVELLKTVDSADIVPMVKGIQLLTGDKASADRKFAEYEKLIREAHSSEERTTIRDILRNIIAILDRTIQRGADDTLIVPYRSFKNNFNRLLAKLGEDDPVSEAPSDVRLLSAYRHKGPQLIRSRARHL